MSLKIIYAALMAGIIFFLAVSLFLNYTAGAFIPGDKQLMQVLLAVSVVLAVSAITAGIYIAGKKIREIPPMDSPEERLENYRSAMIIRAATMEGPAFFFIVCNLLFANYLFIIGAAVCLAVMAVYFPTTSRLEREAGIMQD